ncbi:PREDICTED: peptidyl-alpha-hydroxyglycine alpha-amidating lyase 1-like [Cyphomyrmex costatus]|uniref:peptidylamidoglycolate lyase n=1 Tax=Cyphomyrmex costatus TaxID=456900 RepID=A0A151IQM8_9HYME|nr:PREDICTED: peptidyl-alpha-hydroxyglycine alpha-amidating lyase 1-like [Cyphomyrmex costatus]KYN08474.1 Peptidyl-alpha-hydroxyglycine alpha-amidating lyase 1 [Cyphomyrmex costatus]
MTALRYNTVCSVLILFHILVHTKAALRDILNVQHLADAKFGPNEYSDDDREYSDVDDRDKESLAQPIDQQNTKDHLYSKTESYLDNEEQVIPDTLDENIIWDAQWGTQLKLGQATAISVDPDGNVAIFHRGARVWGPNSFNNENKFDPNNGPIVQNTIMFLDKNGKVISEWGKNMFYLPHGLTIDQSGNYWITDVAMHQVFKFDAQDVKRHMEELKSAQANSKTNLPNNRTSMLKPSMTLGEAFVPGNSASTFCKPTDVAVHTNGDFFVSDGYCNSRIVKYNKNGELILQWGRLWNNREFIYSQSPPPYAFLVAHSLALASELNYLYLADRENGRILCFFANNGTFHKKYRHPAIGTKIYSVAYAREKLYLVNGPDPFIRNPVPVRGFVLDIYSGKILSIFKPKKNMNNPHNLRVTEDGSEIYVVELNNKKVYRFLQEINSSNDSQSTKRRPHQILIHPDTKDADNETNDILEFMLDAVIVIVFSIIMFIMILTTVKMHRRRVYFARKRKNEWSDRQETFQLSSLLESSHSGSSKSEKRPNSRDFSKLNTEPETSEDEHPENSLVRPM